MANTKPPLKPNNTALLEGQIKINTHNAKQIKIQLKTKNISQQPNHHGRSGETYLIQETSVHQRRNYQDSEHTTCST